MLHFATQYAKSGFQHQEKLSGQAPMLCIIRMDGVCEVEKNKRTSLSLCDGCQYNQAALWIQTRRRPGQGNETDHLWRSASVSASHRELNSYQVRAVANGLSFFFFFFIITCAMIPRRIELTFNQMVGFYSHPCKNVP